MSRYLIDQIAARPNIRTLYEAEVVAAHGEHRSPNSISS